VLHMLNLLQVVMEGLIGRMVITHEVRSLLVRCLFALIC
jgi:hypothetical protein